MNPRKPTKEEKQQLLAFQLREAGISLDEVEGNPESNEDGDTKFITANDVIEYQEAVVNSAAIAVFDNYRGSLAKYKGKLMVVVYYSPKQTETYIWSKEGELVREVRFYTSYDKIS